MFLAAECDQDREQIDGGNMLLDTMLETGYACMQLGVRVWELMMRRDVRTFWQNWILI